MTNQQRLAGYAKSGGSKTARVRFPRGKKVYSVTPAQRRRLVKSGMADA